MSNLNLINLIASREKSRTKKVVDLEKKREQIDAQLAAAQARARVKHRKDETRRLILIGKVVILRTQADTQLAEWVRRELDGWLSRRIDRSLFGLDAPAEGALSLDEQRASASNHAGARGAVSAHSMHRTDASAAGESQPPPAPPV